MEDWSDAPEDRRAMASATGHPRYGDRSQELVVITATASPENIAAAQRDALVTDEELELADQSEFVDPFAERHDEMEGFVRQSSALR